MDAADREVAVLRSWAVCLGEYTGLAAPAVKGLWRDRGGEVVGAHAGHARICDQLVRFFAAEMDRLARQDWAGDLLVEIADNRARYPAHWRLQDSPPPVDYLCRGCERRNMVLHPPLEYGARYLVQCPKGGWTLEREEFDHISAVVEQGKHAKAGA